MPTKSQPGTPAATAQAKPEASVEAKASTPATQPDVKAQAKPESKPESKPAPQAELKLEPKVQPQPGMKPAPAPAAAPAKPVGVAAKPVAPVAAKPAKPAKASAAKSATKAEAVQPAKAAPVKAEPVKVEPLPVASAKAEPAKPETAKPAPAMKAAPAPQPAPEPVKTAFPVEAFALKAQIATLVPGEVLPKAVQDFAQSGLSQAREAYATMRQSAESMATGIETSGQATARGIQNFQTSVLDALHANADAAVGYLKAMTGVRTLSEAIEIQSRHARQQFEAAQTQARTLAGIASKTVTEASRPVREALSHSLSRKG